MSVSKLYFMSSDPNSSDAMEAALVNLAADVRGLGGCEAVKVLQDQEIEGRFLFLETWASAEDYAQGSERVSKDALRVVGDLMVGKPEGGWFGHCGE